MKKIKFYILAILMLFGLASCTNDTYSYSYITGRQMSEVKQVFYVVDGMVLSELYQGKYQEFLDVEYERVTEEDSLKMYNKVSQEYQLFFIVEYNESKNEPANTKVYFYNKQFYIVSTENMLYTSVDNFTLEEILSSKADNNCPCPPNNSNDNVTTSPTPDVKISNMEAKLDYGNIVEDHIYLMLDWCDIFFNPSDYNIDTIIAGDIVVVTYSGFFYILTIYPGQVVKEEMTIHSIELIEATVIEFEVSKNEDGDIILLTTDPRYQDRDFQVDAEYVVHEDDTFTNFKDLEEGDIIYGVDSASSDSLIITTIYSYNPRS